MRNSVQIERIIFCMYSDEQYEVYNELIPQYFPSEEGKAKDGEDEKDGGGESLPPPIGQLSIHAD